MQRLQHDGEAVAEIEPIEIYVKLDVVIGRGLGQFRRHFDHVRQAAPDARSARNGVVQPALESRHRHIDQLHCTEYHRVHRGTDGCHPCVEHGASKGTVEQNASLILMVLATFLPVGVGSAADADNPNQ